MFLISLILFLNDSGDNMSIIKYRALLRTLETKSLTKAAGLLGYTQPGISHMITSLEKEMGFPLLIRSREGIEPTQELETILPWIHQIVDGSDRLQEEIGSIHGLMTGNIRIGSFYSISVSWLPTVIGEFSRQHPHIQMQLYEGDFRELSHWLLDGTIDLAVMSFPAPEGYQFISLKTEAILAVLPEHHPLSSQEYIAPSDLVQYPFILAYEGADEDAMLVLKAEKLTPNVRFRIKGDETILSMISQDLGVSLMPDLLLHHLPEGVITRPLVGGYARTLGIAIRSEQEASPAVRSFVQLFCTQAATPDFFKQTENRPRKG